MKKLLAFFIATSFFIACHDNPNADKNVNKDSIQTISHDSTITKPATTDTSDKSMGKDSTNPANNPPKSTKK
jgi:hypothetical protein